LWEYRDSNKLSEVAESHSDFFLSFNQDGDAFSLKKNHPYHYQIQQQMIVTGSLFGVLLVFIECDIAVVYVPVENEACCEIKSKINTYMFKVMLSQLGSGNFEKSDWDKVNISSGMSLEIVNESECCAVESEVLECAETSNSNDLSCCQNVLKDKEDFNKNISQVVCHAA
jgi:hypothetical protein